MLTLDERRLEYFFMQVYDNFILESRD